MSRRLTIAALLVLLIPAVRAQQTADQVRVLESTPAANARIGSKGRQAILAAMASNLHSKWVVAVEPDIDIRNSAEVEWAQSFRVKPREDVFVVDRTDVGLSDCRRAGTHRRACARRPNELYYPSGIGKVERLGSRSIVWERDQCITHIVRSPRASLCGTQTTRGWDIRR